ncbi:MAG: ABC transporter ATP-binding protein [Deltaproteobacteria bacterium]|nr:ABC transporter ATP-binding protein [Deltaproteobacteria bacterium]
MKALSFFLKKYSLIYGALTVITILYACFESLNISIFLPLLQSAFSAFNDVSTKGTYYQVLEKIIHLFPFNSPFLNTCLLMFIVLIIKEILGFARQVLNGYGSIHVSTQIQRQLFGHYGHMSFDFFLQEKQGDLNYRLMVSPGKLARCLYYIPELLKAITMTMTVGVLLFLLSWKLTLLLMIGALGFNFISKKMSEQISYLIGAERTRQRRLATVVVNEFIDGIKHIRIFNVLTLWIQKFSKPIMRFRELTIRDFFWLAVPDSFAHIVPTFVIAAMAIYVYFFTSREPTVVLQQLAPMGVYALGIYRILPFLAMFGRSMMQIMGELPDVELLFQELNRPPQVHAGSVSLKNFNKAIVFENVSFEYARNASFRLEHISFQVTKGEKVALVGVSGSGKSTLLHLLFWLFTPSSGRILIDDIELLDINPEDRASILSFVSQEGFIFHDTIAENIRFGLSNVSEEELKSAAHLAYADEFIKNLPQGYDTVVGDKGLKLSGGERQRIAVARAILRKSPIIVLDEATSALDVNSEAIIQKGLTNLLQNKTVITVSHRFSSLHYVDRIIELSNGKIVQESQHTELPRDQGVFLLQP